MDEDPEGHEDSVTHAGPSVVFHPVPFVQQQHSWDCGLACVLMVLRALGRTQVPDLDGLKLLCKTERWALWDGGEHQKTESQRGALFQSPDPLSSPSSLHALPFCSVWSVDLAVLLRRFGLEVRYLTTTIGANPQYAAEQFYADCLEEDVQRVEQLFR